MEAARVKDFDKFFKNVFPSVKLFLWWQIYLFILAYFVTDAEEFVFNVKRIRVLEALNLIRDLFLILWTSVFLADQRIHKALLLNKK